jgi:hypothetical protein
MLLALRRYSLIIPVKGLASGKRRGAESEVTIPSASKLSRSDRGKVWDGVF